MAGRHGENKDLTNDMTWLLSAQDDLTWDSMKRHFVNSRHLQPTGPATPDRHADENRTNVTRAMSSENDGARVMRDVRTCPSSGR